MFFAKNRKEDSRSLARILFSEQLLFLFLIRLVIVCFRYNYNGLVVVLSAKIVVFKQITTMNVVTWLMIMLLFLQQR